MNFAYLKEPCFVYDLIYAICLSINKDSIFSELKRQKLANEEDLSFYDSLISQCGKLPEDIIPFFYIEKNGPCFLTLFYLLNKTDFERYSIQTLLSELKDLELLKNNLSEFYFGSKNRYNDDYMSLIEKADLSLNLKYRITRVFANLSNSSRLVISIVEKVIPIINEIYMGFDNIIKDKIMMLSENDRIEKLYKFNEINKNYNTNLFISISIINRFGCLAIFHDNDFFLLGDDFINKIDTLFENNNIEINMPALGKILSEPIRLKILSLLKEYHEIYTGELCEILDMSLTAVFYHVNMMLLEKMLKTRNEGRKVFYSINNDYFDALSKEFLKFKS
jgi:ArsR family transcriptional regulator